MKILKINDTDEYNYNEIKYFVCLILLYKSNHDLDSSRST